MNLQNITDKAWLLLIPADENWVKENVVAHPLWSELDTIAAEIWAQGEGEHDFSLVAEKSGPGNIYEGHQLAMRTSRRFPDMRLMLFWLKKSEADKMYCYPYQAGRQQRGGSEDDWRAFGTMHTLGPPLYTKRKAKDPPQLSCAYVDGLPPPNFIDELYPELYQRFLEHSGKADAYNDPDTPHIMFRHALELYMTPGGHPVLYSEPFNMLYFRRILLNYFPFSDIYIFHRELASGRLSVIIEDREHWVKGSYLHPVIHPGDCVFADARIPLYDELWGEKMPKQILEKAGIPPYLLGYEAYPDTYLDPGSGRGDSDF